MKLNNYIYKFLDVENNHFLSNMENGEIICKHFQDFNDPYESHFGINAIWPCPYKNKNKLVELIMRIEPKTFKQITKSRYKMIEYIQSHSKLRDYSLDIISNQLMNFRVCSFTRRWNHILMWSHYANGCRGLALVLDKDKILECDGARKVGSQTDLSGVNIPLKWITYYNVPPILNSVEVLEAGRIGSEGSIEAISQKMLDICVLSKFKAWKYEQETRMITRIEENIEKSPILYKYNPAALKGVIFGFKCDINKIKTISELLPDDCTIHLTKPAANKYKVEVVQSWKACQVASGEVEIRQVVG